MYIFYIIVIVVVCWLPENVLIFFIILVVCWLPKMSVFFLHYTVFVVVGGGGLKCVYFVQDYCRCCLLVA